MCIYISPFPFIYFILTRAHNSTVLWLSSLSHYHRTKSFDDQLPLSLLILSVFSLKNLLGAYHILIYGATMTVHDWKTRQKGHIYVYVLVGGAFCANGDRHWRPLDPLNGDTPLTIAIQMNGSFRIPAALVVPMATKEPMAVDWWQLRQ